ncbi:MAG: helix-turn-helix domain-containing protein [archaeon]
MDLPQEIEVWYVLPSLRKDLAQALKEKGTPQKEIAKLLDVSEGAISQYFSKKRGSSVSFPIKIRQEIKASAKKLLNKGNSGKELLKLAALVKKEKILCKLHKKLGRPPHNCKICVKP